jgi:hypothetical protein
MGKVRSVSKEDFWNPYDKEQPRFKPPKILYVAFAVVAMGAVGFVVSMLNLKQPHKIIGLPPSALAVKASLPIRGHNLSGYEVENLSAVWTGEIKEPKADDTVDLYEVSGQVRRYEASAPAVITLEVEMRIKALRFNVEYVVVQGLKLNSPKKFKVNLKDPTHARVRQADLNFVVSTQKNLSEE